MGLSNKLSCEAGSFSFYRNPDRFFFQSVVLRLYFPLLEPWVAWSVLFPICLSTCKCGTTRSSSHGLAPCPCCPSCPSPPLLLPAWMNISSLTPWLSDFHKVQFSGSSVFFFFFVLNMLLSFFWLCEEAKCIYLCLHLGWKFPEFLIDSEWLFLAFIFEGEFG